MVKQRKRRRSKYTGFDLGTVVKDTLHGRIGVIVGNRDFDPEQAIYGPSLVVLWDSTDRRHVERFAADSEDLPSLRIVDSAPDSRVVRELMFGGYWWGQAY